MPAGLAKIDEIPEGWGLLEVTKAGLRRKKVAKQREIDPPALSFIASIARRASEPPPQIPAMLWKFAGEDVPLEALEKLANGATLRAAEAIKREAQAIVKADENTAQVYEAVRSELGDWGTHNLDRLKGYLKVVNHIRKAGNYSYTLNHLIANMTEAVQVLDSMEEET